MVYDTQNRMVADAERRWHGALRPTDHENLRVWVQAADGSESFVFYLGTQNLATYSLKRDAQGNLVFRLSQSTSTSASAWRRPAAR